MYLYSGIATVILGIAIAILGFTNVLPYVNSSGIFLVLLGGLFIGFHFIPRPVSEEEIGEPMPVWERLVKVFFSPAELFRSFRYHPRWMVAVLIASIFAGVYSLAFYQRLTPEVIVNQNTEKLGESGWIPQEEISVTKKKNIEVAKSPVAKVGNFINSFVGYTFLAALLGAVYLLIILAMGGKINYWQSLSVAAYSMFAIILIQKSFSLLILFLKEPSEIHPMLGQNSLLMDNLSFLVSSGQNPVLYVLLAALSLTALYSLFLTAVGLKNAGYNVSAATGWVAGIVVYLFGLTLTVVSALAFGNMFS